MSILSRLFNRRKPAAPAPEPAPALVWKVWQYCGRARGWEVICTGEGPVDALRMAQVADRIFPDRNHRVSCRPQ